MTALHCLPDCLRSRRRTLAWRSRFGRGANGGPSTRDQLANERVWLQGALQKHPRWCFGHIRFAEVELALADLAEPGVYACNALDQRLSAAKLSLQAAAKLAPCPKDAAQIESLQRRVHIMGGLPE